MSGSLLMGIDGGTQSTKVVVVDADGIVVAEASEPLRELDLPARGQVEHPDDDLWGSLVVATRAAMETLGPRRADIVGIGLCSIRFCRALMRADGTLARPVMSWMDERVSRPHEEAGNEQVSYVGAASAYLTARLTGKVADSTGNYAGLWPIDHQTWNWLSDDEQVRAAIGVSRSMLPELVLPGDVLGVVTSGAAEATGLPVGVPVVATANDKAVEGLGNGLCGAGQLELSLGTYITAMKPATAKHPDTAARWSNFACQPHRYLDESAGIRRGMSTLSWMRDLVKDGLSDRAQTAGVSLEHVMNEAAAEVPAGSDGLLTILDWLAPADQLYRRGVMFGFDARHKWPHMYRSILEGIAMTMRGNVDAMLAELGESIDAIVVAGGGSRSDVMMQIVADVFEVPAQRAPVTSGAGLGAAICAAVATGIHPSFEHAVAAMVHPGDEFTPDPDAVASYRLLREVYSALPTHLEPALRQLHQTGL